jgi:hypothetical protein
VAGSSQEYNEPPTLIKGDEVVDKLRHYYLLKMDFNAWKQCYLCE